MTSRKGTVMNRRHPCPGILFLAGSLFSGCWLLPGCGPAAGPASFSTPPAKKQQNRNQGPREVDYHLKGVVKKVDPASGKLMIAHEAIEGFMDAMTMPFAYQDRAVLEDLRRRSGRGHAARRLCRRRGERLRAARACRRQAGARSHGHRCVERQGDFTRQRPASRSGRHRARFCDDHPGRKAG